MHVAAADADTQASGLSDRNSVEAMFIGMARLMQVEEQRIRLSPRLQFPKPSG